MKTGGMKTAGMKTGGMFPLKGKKNTFSVYQCVKFL